MSITRGAVAAIFAYVSCLDCKRAASRRRTRRAAKEYIEESQRHWAGHEDVDAYTENDHHHFPQVFTNLFAHKNSDGEASLSSLDMDSAKLATQQPAAEDLTLRTISRSDTTSTVPRKGPFPPIFAPPGTTIKQFVESINPLNPENARRPSIAVDPEGKKAWKKPARSVAASRQKRSKTYKWKPEEVDMLPVVTSNFAADPERLAALRELMYTGKPLATQIQTEMTEMWQDGRETAGVFSEPASPGPSKLRSRLDSDTGSLSTRLMAASRRAVNASSGGITKLRAPSRRLMERMTSSPAYLGKGKKPADETDYEDDEDELDGDGSLDRPAIMTTQSDPTPLLPQIPHPTISDIQLPRPAHLKSSLSLDGAFSIPGTPTPELAPSLPSTLRSPSPAADFGKRKGDTSIPMILITATTDMAEARLASRPARRTQSHGRRATTARRGARRISPRRSLSSSAVTEILLRTSAGNEKLDLRALRELSAEPASLLNARHGADDARTLELAEKLAALRVIERPRTPASA